MDKRTTVTLEGFGERLRLLRSAAGMSQDDLARRSGLSTAGIGALERGVRRAPQPETIAQAATSGSMVRRARFITSLFLRWGENYVVGCLAQTFLSVVRVERGARAVPGEMAFKPYQASSRAHAG